MEKNGRYWFFESQITLQRELAFTPLVAVVFSSIFASSILLSYLAHPDSELDDLEYEKISKCRTRPCK